MVDHDNLRDRLDAAAATSSGESPRIVRRFDDGRTAIAHATVDGRSLLEYADGSREVVNACDTQHVGPDPDKVARGDLVHAFDWVMDDHDRQELARATERMQRRDDQDGDEA